MAREFLVDMHMTQSEFDNLLCFENDNDWKYLPIQSLFKTNKGTVCRIVPSGELYCHQVGAALFSLPAVGLQHFKPVIATK